MDGWVLYVGGMITLAGADFCWKRVRPHVLALFDDNAKKLKDTADIRKGLLEAEREKSSLLTSEMSDKLRKVEEENEKLQWYKEEYSVMSAALSPQSGGVDERLGDLAFVINTLVDNGIRLGHKANKDVADLFEKASDRISKEVLPRIADLAKLAGYTQEQFDAELETLFAGKPQGLVAEAFSHLTMAQGEMGGVKAFIAGSMQFVPMMAALRSRFTGDLGSYIEQVAREVEWSKGDLSAGWRLLEQSLKVESK